MDYQDRDLAMRELYLAGQTLSEIGERYGLTRQRVQQILQKVGGVTALQARSARQQARDKRLTAQVEAFLTEYGNTIEVLAASGCSRTDLEARFSLLRPAIPSAVVREGVAAADVLFDIVVQELIFSTAVIESAVWYVLARSLNLAADWSIALKEVDLQDAREVAAALQDQGLDAETSASVLCLVASAKAHASTHVGVALTKKRYEEVRGWVLQDLGLQSRRGSAPWPPTSQTVMKRLGDGFWADALTSIGLTPGPRGRSRGLLVFREQDYDSAVVDYLAQTAATGQDSTFSGYERWVEIEERSGRRRPSSAAVRLRYRNWTNAKRMVAASGARPPSRLDGLVRPVATVSTSALHHAQEELTRFLTALGDTRPVQASALIEGFIRSFAEEFELRRRDWLRAAVSLDPTAARRCLASGSLPRPQRDALTRTPADVDAALTDRYLDHMLSGGDPRRTDDWLRADAQAELDALPDEVALQFSVLRAARNYLTHASEESRTRLQAAIQRLGTVDPRFELHQPLTRRVLIDWVRAADARRLRSLGACIPALWRAMVVAETVLQGSSTSTTSEAQLTES